ncbi:MAG: hypothetical protein E4H43_00045 [Bacteroidia bacterium]|nr:MAG: hypothetical protein E4H43_00045 [Bacteroidia bacterium]
MKGTKPLFVIMCLVSTMATAIAQNPVINKTVQTAVKNKIDNPAAIDRDITSRLNTVTVSTIKISAVADISAWSTYSYKTDAHVIQHGVCVSKGPSPTIQNSKFFPKGDPGPEFGAEITGLSPNTKYYVRAFAKDNSGTVYYGNELTFTTLNPKK